MCINIFNFLKKRNDIMPTIDYIDLSINHFQYALFILEENEPDLVLRYSANGTILFSKRWFLWYNRLHKEAFEFMSRFKPPQLDYTSQLVYLCRIPEEYQEEFLNVIKREYS